MPFDERSFDNPFLSTKPQNSDPNKILTADVKCRIKQFLHSHVGVLQDRLSDGSISSRDTSVYTGLSGIALTLLKVEESRILSQERGKGLIFFHLWKVSWIVSSAFSHVEIDAIYFISIWFGPKWKSMVIWFQIVIQVSLN